MKNNQSYHIQAENNYHSQAQPTAIHKTDAVKNSGVLLSRKGSVKSNSSMSVSSQSNNQPITKTKNKENSKQYTSMAYQRLQIEQQQQFDHFQNNQMIDISLSQKQPQNYSQCTSSNYLASNQNLMNKDFQTLNGNSVQNSERNNHQIPNITSSKTLSKMLNSQSMISLMSNNTHNSEKLSQNEQFNARQAHQQQMEQIKKSTMRRLSLNSITSNPHNHTTVMSSFNSTQLTQHPAHHHANNQEFQIDKSIDLVNIKEGNFVQSSVNPKREKQGQNIAYSTVNNAANRQKSKKYSSKRESVQISSSKIMDKSPINLQKTFIGAQRSPMMGSMVQSNGQQANSNRAQTNINLNKTIKASFVSSSSRLSCKNNNQKNQYGSINTTKINSKVQAQTKPSSPVKVSIGSSSKKNRHQSSTKKQNTSCKKIVNKPNQNLFLNLSKIDGGKSSQMQKTFNGSLSHRDSDRSSTNQSKIQSSRTKYTEKSQASDKKANIYKQDQSQKFDDIKFNLRTFKRNSFYEENRLNLEHEDMTHGYYDQAPISERRRMSATEVQSEIAMIKQKQREREEKLIEKFNFLKIQAQETIQIHHQQMLSQTQPITNEQYEQRMDKFEKIIGTLLERQNINMDGDCHKFDQNFNGSIPNSRSQKQSSTLYLNKNTFGDSGLINSDQNKILQPSGQFNMLDSASNTLYLNQFHNIYQGQSSSQASSPNMQRFQNTQSQMMLNLREIDQQNIISSQSSTHDQRYDNYIQLDRSDKIEMIDKKNALNSANNNKLQSSDNSRKFNPIDDTISPNPQNMLSSEFNPSKHQVSHFNLNYSNNNIPQPSSRQIKGFLETLQSLEDFSQNKIHNQGDLSHLRDKLQNYKDQLALQDQSQIIDQSFYNQQISVVQALENILLKLDSQLINQDRSQTQDEISQIQKQKYVILLADDKSSKRNSRETNQTLTAQDSSLTTPKNVSHNQDSRNPSFIHPQPQQQQIVNTLGDFADINEITNQSYIQSSRKNHLKNCNRGGFQVKHSRYRNEPDLQVPLDTNEEISNGKGKTFGQGESQLGWLSEIKHIKALLGSMAEEHGKSQTMYQYENSNAQKIAMKKDKESLNSTQSQCIIM
eukprot:403373301